jgi:hypothetical protein
MTSSSSHLPSLIKEEKRFPFTGLGGTRSYCRLRLFNAASAGKVTAIVTEISDKTGTSVTNAAGQLAGAICERFGIEPQRFVLIEHYAEERGARGTFDESYSRVNLDYHPRDGFRRIDWTYLRPEDVARLTDTPAEEWKPSPVVDEELEGVEA